MTPRATGRRRRPDPARELAFDVLRDVHADDAYANLALGQRLASAGLDARDAAFATELVAGTCRGEGTYDAVLTAASGRDLDRLDPMVVDVLRLGAHQLLAMRVPAHAAVAASVDLAAAVVGERVTGLVNAVLRRAAARDLNGWIESLSKGLEAPDVLALRTSHPRWVVDAYADSLPSDELEPALAANNIAPRTCLVVRPGLAQVDELPGEPTPYSPYGALLAGNPAGVPAVRAGRAGVQDEGSQLVALALARVADADGPWLDLCAGPGGKTALLTGLARQRGTSLLANEVQPHRAVLVARALRAYPGRPNVVCADGTRAAWRPGAFAAVLADVPCTGLGALRRRPESRWRRHADDLADLRPLQLGLLNAALDAVRPGGVVGYVTCSPHRAETAEIVAAVADRVDVLAAAAALPEVPDCAVGDFVQLWPHRHGTDAMFLALLRRR